MKNVAVVTSLCTLLISVPGLAQSALATAPDVVVPAVTRSNEIQFALSGSTGYSERVTYYCSDVEAYASGMLRHMGATNVRTHCGAGPTSGTDGGAAEADPNQPVYEPVVTAMFDSIRLPSNHSGGAILRANWQKIAFMGMDNCTLTLDLFKNLHSYFELSEVKGADSCGFENGPYKVTMLTLFRR